MFFCGAALLASEAPAEQPSAEQAAGLDWSEILNWSLLWTGSWEESKTLHNRGEIKLSFLSPGLQLRGQVLDRRPLNFELEPPFGGPEKWITHFTGGLYHIPTGSRLLYGVLDEWGLPARIRNPWIRSPPYAENHGRIAADIKTAASSTRDDELYLYLSSPFLEFSENFKFRGFVSAQSEAEEFTPALAGGLDFAFTNKNGLLLETFFTWKTLEPSNVNSWFSYPPPLPERDFRLYSASLLYTNPAFSISSNFALSETFAWGTDIYASFAAVITPALPFGNRARPLAVSLAADGAGERFVNRDGAGVNEGFRTAAKIEWRGRNNSLARLNMTLRSDGIDEDFNRSQTGFYWRFPSSAAARRNIVRLTRISFSADRNAANLQKISDSYSGYLGLNFNLLSIHRSLQRNGDGLRRNSSAGRSGTGGLFSNSTLGLNLSGSFSGLTTAQESGSISVFPVPDEFWNWDAGSAGCELILSAAFRGGPGNYQFRTKAEYLFFAEKEEKWDISFSTSARFRYGRLSIKAASPDFPKEWNWTVSWRLEKPQ